MGKVSLSRTLSVIKSIMVFMNFLSLLAGLILIAVGFYVYSTEEQITYITSSPMRYHLPYAMITLGGLISLVSFLGCFGAANEQPVILTFYFGLLFILVISQIAVGSLAFSYRQDVDSILEKTWSTAFQENPKLIINLEKYLQCCGFDDITDRAVPPNCSREFKFDVPCHDSMRVALMNSLQTIGVVGVVLGIMELTGLLFAAVLFIRLSETEDEAKQALLAETRLLDQEIDKTYQRRKMYTTA
ncbi:13403_t:CDS:2 [Ambispora leptoticha]|uniref:13403_t:CDS:1 n=1 Tax=Ambispora leptoticha TaxID=144679 RepID=A0A9N8W8P8_9GLOM|nr:13403_t:CDS:2 [Ambispora leptoticha]